MKITKQIHTLVHNVMYSLQRLQMQWQFLQADINCPGCNLLEHLRIPVYKAARITACLVDVLL